MKNQIAGTILRQLGGHRFIAMTGARMLVDRNNGLSFHYPNSKICVITLEPSDTYRIEFYRFNRKNFKTILLKTYDQIYCDNLVEIFENYTGLLVSL